MRAVSSLLISSTLAAGCATYHARPLQAPELERAYHARTLADARLRAFVETTMASTAAAWPPSALDLKTLTLVGYYYSADLDVARAHIGAAEAGIRAAGARINPGVSGNVGYNQDPSSHVEGGIGPVFTIETAGKRGVRILQAEYEAEAARTGLAEAAWQLRSRIRGAFVDHLLAAARLDLLEEEERTRAEIVDIFERRLAVGEAARPELDLYRVDLIVARASLRLVVGDVAQTRAAVANAVGLPTDALTNVAWTAPWFGAPVSDETLPILAVQRAGLVHRADVRRSLSDFAAADASLRLELARQYPDLTLSPAYNFEEGFARYVLAVTLEPLAVFHRNQGLIAAAEAKREEAAARFEALQAKAIGETERALIQYRAAFEQWRQASEELTTVQRDREDAARRALAAGEGDRLRVATAHLETLTTARTRLEALAHVQAALGALEDAMQQPLEDALTVPEPSRVGPRAGGVAQ